MYPLRKAREKLGISQRELAARTNIHQTTISKAELGNGMTRKQAEILARFFGFPWEEKHFLYPERYIELNPEEAA